MNYLNQSKVRRELAPGRRVKRDAVELIDTLVATCIRKINRRLEECPGQRTVDREFVAIAIEKHL